jgi:starch synthase
MRVFVASSEIYPYSKTGGLADFAHAIIKNLRKKGINAMGVTPLSLQFHSFQGQQEV